MTKHVKLTETFRREVLKHLIANKDRRYPLAKVASAIGMSYKSLHKRIHGQTKFSLVEAILLLRAVPEPKLAQALLAETPFIAAIRPQKEKRNTDLYWRLHDAIAETVAVSTAAHKAMQDGRIDHRDRTNILTEIAAAETAIATLRAYIEDHR